MAPFGRAELYWPELMLMTVLAIYRPALRVGLGRQKCRVSVMLLEMVIFQP